MNPTESTRRGGAERERPGKPVLMKVNCDDGHFTEEKTVTFRNFAGQYAFMLWQTGHKDFQPAN
jgi:prolyl oligopeptidase